MKRFTLFIWFFLAAAAVGFGQAQSPAQSIENVVVVRLYNTENIDVGQYKAFVALSTLSKMYNERNPAAQLSAAEKREALNAIGNQILIHQAAEREKLLIEDRNIEQYVSQEMTMLSNVITQQSGGKTPTPAELDQILQNAYGMTRATYKKFITYRLNARNYVEKKKQSVLEPIARTLPTEEELLVLYNQRKSRSVLQQGFFVPESVVVQMLVVPFLPENKTAAKATADRLSRQIGNNAKEFDIAFTNAAAEAEKAPANNAITGNGNEIRPLTDQVHNDPLLRERFGNSFIDAIFRLDQGRISQVLEGPTGFYLIKVTQNMPSKTLVMNDVVGQGRHPQNPSQVINITVRDFLGEEEMQRRYDTAYLKAYDEVIADLKKKGGSVQIITGTYDRITW